MNETAYQDIREVDALVDALGLPRDVAEDVVARTHRKVLEGRRQLRSIMRGMFPAILQEELSR